MKMTAAQKASAAMNRARKRKLTPERRTEIAKLANSRRKVNLALRVEEAKLLLAEEKADE